MAQVPRIFDHRTPSRNGRLLLALPLVAGLLAAMATLEPLLAFLALASMAMIFALAKWPEASTLAVIFILYSNVAKVAVDFHGVPFILGASFFLLLSIPFVDYVVLRREKIIIQPTFVLLVLFTLVQLAGTVLARHPDVAAKELFSSLTEGVLLYFLVSNVVRTPQTLRRVVWTLVAAGVLMSLAPCYQQMTGQFNNHFGGFGQVSNAAFELEADARMSPVQPRLAGSVGEQNRFAQVMLMLLPLALFRWRGESATHLRILAALSAALIIVAVVLTFSRGAAAGMVALLVTMVALGYIRVQGVVAVLVLVAAVHFAIPQYATRIAKLQGLWALVDAEGVGHASPDGSTKSRITEMGAAGLAFLDHPLVGVGPGMFRHHYREYAEQIGLRVFAKGRQSHSIIPGLAAETGVLGLLLFASIIVITLRDLIRAHGRWKESHPDQANMAASFVLVVIAYLGTAMFLHMAYVRYFWLMMALASAASRVTSDDTQVVLASKEQA